MLVVCYDFTMHIPSLILCLKRTENCWAWLVYACNPIYSGGRDQEDLGSKPAGQIVHEILRSYLIANTKQGWWNGSSGRGPA
jgi:hypothetical protein